MGGGITGAKGDPEQNEELQKMSREYFNMAKPLFKTAQGGAQGILNQGPGQFATLAGANQEAMRTGGSNAYAPYIGRAVEASARAGSQGLQKTREDLTRQNITGSDYNQQLGNAIQQMYFNTSQAPADLYKQMGQDASTYGYQQAGKNQDFYRDIVSHFYNALSQAPQVGLQGMGASAQNAAQINAANTAAGAQFVNNLQTMGGATQGSGGGVAAAAAGCWMAARLYGRHSPEFYYARYWLMHGWHGKTARLVRRLYITYGERLSRHPWLVRGLKPFFDWAVTQGRRACYG